MTFEQLDVFALVIDFDYRAFQEGKMDKVKRIDSLVNRLAKSMGVRARIEEKP